MRSKVITGIMLILMLMGVLPFSFTIQPVKAEARTWTVDDDGPADFNTIQEAVNTASPEDIIYVYNGTYYENIVVNKTVSLIGEDKYNAIVDGNSAGNVINVTAENVNINGFTIQNSGTTSVESGIHLSYNISGSNISCNIIGNNLYGIRLYDSSNNILTGNRVSNNGYGIYLHSSSYNTLVGNIVTDNAQGICLKWASHSNVLVANNVSNNLYDGIWTCSSNNNMLARNSVSNNKIGIDVCMSSNNNAIFHNNFINNTEQTSVRAELRNIWDDGYPSGGNYWSDFSDVDLHQGPYQNETGIDGIWDHPYIIDENNHDNYPLVSPYWYWSNPMIGDFNKDMVVDMKDISLVAKAFGSYPGHPRWNPVVDLNQDNRVDMRDLATVARNFGKTV